MKKPLVQMNMDWNPVQSAIVNLAKTLLMDDEGLSSKAYDQLQRTVKLAFYAAATPFNPAPTEKIPSHVQKMFDSVDATDGRFYLPYGYK